MELGIKCLRILKELGEISETEDGLTRLYLTPEHRKANDFVKELMKSIGLEVHEDEVGNVIGTLKSKTETKKTLHIGSHIDSVRMGGIFDGMVGIISPLIALEEIIKKNIPLPYNIKVISFGTEEGVRFNVPYLTSKYYHGYLEDEVLSVDKNGTSVMKALEEFYNEKPNLKEKKLDKDNDIYLEVHIEQGPILENKDLPIGIVENINGFRRYKVVIDGIAGHAGTVPNIMRKDALVAASKIISHINELAIKNDVFATVGVIDVKPYSINVIPSKATFTIDIRSHSDEKIDKCLKEITQFLKKVKNQSGISFSIEKLTAGKAVKCSKKIIRYIEKGFEKSNDIPFRLNSGAGHDAQELSKSVEVGMIFVRCKGGISHNPNEDVSAKDLDVLCKSLIEILKEINY